MIERLKSLFFGDADTASGGAEDEARLACAALLVEASMMDGEMAASERDHILRILTQRFPLSVPEAESLLTRAIAAQGKTSQLFPFTRAITQCFSASQRVELIEMLWEVAYADGRLHDYEANLVRRIAGLIYVPDQESGGARRRAMASLGLSDSPLA